MATNRKFTVGGTIKCLFEPEITPTDHYVKGVEVELWCKQPLNVYFLGKGMTNDTGTFSIEFETDLPLSASGEMEDVFLKVYYQGILITGNNPYEPA